MNIDINLWENKSRMRLRIKNLGTMVMSISAVNIFYKIINKNWILTSINGLFLISVIPLFISYTKWEKIPPKEEENGK